MTRTAIQLLAAIALALASTPLAARPAAAESELDLLGTWFVLIHYRDESTAHPERERWEDRVWRFESKGSRLEWTDYPIVVFEDTTGRFESRAGNRRARTLAFWEPNEEQRAQIGARLEINTRGSKTKTLRGSPEKGYGSVGSLRTASAAIVGYHETWKIEGLPDAPVFSRIDSMGTGRGGGTEGVTRYTTTEIRDGVLVGTYERDGTRHGTFRMMRSGDAESVGTKKSVEERVRDAISVPGLSAPEAVEE